MDIKKSQAFVHRNARPLDLALWNFYFENGSAQNVLEELSYYQNPDGGFANALEIDNFNPNSNPIAVWKASEYIKKVGLKDKNHPIIKDMIKYLSSLDGFFESTNQWGFSVPSNNEYPHAVWWEYEKEPESFSPNPTAALAGFIICYADENSDIYKTAENCIKRAFEYMPDNAKIKEDLQHNLPCLIRLYEYCIQANYQNIETDKVKEIIEKYADLSICPETEKWITEYVPIPSTYIMSHESFLVKGKEKLIEKELIIIDKSQLPDGSFYVPWQWHNDYPEKEISRNWSRAEITINKIYFYQTFHKISNSE